jgi:hypothetical protein
MTKGGIGNYVEINVRETTWGNQEQTGKNPSR